jgi:hypothetical protein
VLLACAGGCLGLVPAAASADLWVSRSGANAGSCAAVVPCATISYAVSRAAPGNTIYVGPGTYADHVSIPTSVSPLTIRGAGMHATAISGGFGPIGSVLTVQPQATATVNDVTIEGGTAPDGGGVLNRGVLAMERDDVTANVAVAPPGTDGYGGGIDSTFGQTTIEDSEILHNQASHGGGGFRGPDDAFMILSRDLVEGNVVHAVAQAGFGGGVLLLGPGTASDDTIADNVVIDGSGNPAGSGAGVFSFGGEVSHDTIVGNSAGSGGGISGNLVAADSIIAGNTGGDCGGSIAYAGVSLSQDGSCESPGSGGLIGDPQLGTLADNGGPSLTLAIPSSSPAYDATSSCPGTDQRGVSLLQRGASRCDLGAYQISAPTTYVPNVSANSLTAYATGANGNTPPVLDVHGLVTGLSGPKGVVADASGDVFVANSVGSSITEYAPEVTGNVAPLATIAGSNTGLDHPQDLGLDGSGHLFASNIGSITEYAAGANGNVTPIARIMGAATQLNFPHAPIIDASGKLRVSNANGTITTYAVGANGNVAPLSKLAPRGLIDPAGMNFDPAGDLLVADFTTGKADTFAAGASGPASPTSFLTGTPALQSPIGLDLDETGDVYVADGATNAVSEFAPHSSGAAAPIATISGPATGLNLPAYLSELPPPPTPGVRAMTDHRQTRARILRDGITVRLTAAGRAAFRAEPVTIAVLARAHRRTLATLPRLPLRPGTTRLRLRDTRAASHLLPTHRRTPITLIISVRDGAGAQRHHLTITATP